MVKMRVPVKVQRDLLNYARWHDVPSWSAWVETVAYYRRGGTGYQGCPAIWLPWNQNRRPKKEGINDTSIKASFSK
jgi:hypothetical protein